MQAIVSTVYSSTGFLCYDTIIYAQTACTNWSVWPRASNTILSAVLYRAKNTLINDLQILPVLFFLATIWITETAFSSNRTNLNWAQKTACFYKLVPKMILPTEQYSSRIVILVSFNIAFILLEKDNNLFRKALLQISFFPDKGCAYHNPIIQLKLFNYIL